MFSRKGEDWVTELLVGPDTLLHLPEIEADIPLDELYADIDLAAAHDEAAEP